MPAAPLKQGDFQRAFTLIEMLVVMVIISLLITVIMQGFGYSLGMYQRVVSKQKNAYTEVLAYNWLRSTLGASVAARPKDRGLEGNTVEVATYTYQPLIEPMGLKTRVAWVLVQDAEKLSLKYREGETQFNVYSWTNATGQWEYMDDKNNWHSQWPVIKEDLPPLPHAIRLQVLMQQDVFNYVVSINLRKTSKIEMDE